MTAIVRRYDWVFDVVQLGIDMRYWRLARGMSQKEVAAEMAGKPTPSYISAIETGNLTDGMSMRMFLECCRLLDSKPEEYFTIERRLL